MRTHCIRGHEMTAENIYQRTDRDGVRCRKCMHFNNLKRSKTRLTSKWTEVQLAELYRLKGEGKSALEIAEIMGCKRSRIDERLRRDRMTPEQRRAHEKQKTEWARKNGGGTQRQSYRPASTTIASRPSDELIAEARRRADAPRSLSAMLLGDPPRGFSALDRKQGEAHG